MILVDAAVWPFRGRRWAHLVSDTSYGELHDFARRIGKRRIGFQGDHYDVDEAERERALSAGAIMVDSRQLVSRLRAAGLRRRGGVDTWDLLAREPIEVEHVGARTRDLLPALTDRAERLVVEAGHLLTALSPGSRAPVATVDLLLVRRPGEHAAVLTSHDTRPPPDWYRDHDGLTVVSGHDEARAVVEVIESVA